MSRISALSAVAIIAALVSFPASAGPAKNSKGIDRTAAGAATAYTSSKAPVSTDEPVSTSSVAAPALEPGCHKSRKRLWVESEGWVVRRVTTCF